jgi:hypothetical protein
MTAAEQIAQFLESEGHRVETSPIEGAGDLCELVFRTRGQMFSISISEMEPTRYTLSTAYEIPDWVRDRSHTVEALGDVETDFPETRFILAHDDTIFVATVEYQAIDMETFFKHFWNVVSRLRQAGNTAVERIVDRSESKAAADKFIRQFMKGER